MFYVQIISLSYLKDFIVSQQKSESLQFHTTQQSRYISVDCNVCWENITHSLLSQPFVYFAQGDISQENSNQSINW